MKVKLNLNGLTQREKADIESLVAKLNDGKRMRSILNPDYFKPGFPPIADHEIRDKYSQLMWLALELCLGFTYLAKLVDIDHLELSASRVRQALALQAAKSRLEVDRDGKQAAKRNAFKLWQDWQGGRASHKSGAAFARFVCGACPTLESPTTVERWVRKWAAEKAKYTH